MNTPIIILLQAEKIPTGFTAIIESFLASPTVILIGTWIAAGLTLIMFSFIFGDNPLFKLGEHLYLGLSAAWLMALYWFNFIKPNFVYRLIPPLNPAFDPSVAPWYKVWDPWVIIPAILGVFIILRIIRPLAWMSRITFAFYIGGFSGIAIPKVINGLLLPQFFSTIQKIDLAPGSGAELLGLINALILFVGAFTVLIYFFFSVEHKGTIGWLSRVGIYFLMIAFGASFGYTIMARVSLLIGRMQFLLIDWLHLNKIFPGAG